MGKWWLLKLIPKNLLSRLVGALVRIRLPGPLRIWALKWFAGRYRLNMDEAERPLHEYATIQDLFTRRLKSSARPILGEWVHPVDGELTKIQPIQGTSLVQAKGLNFAVSDLLGESSQAFLGGHALTYYLCPTDYHRVHAPVWGEIERARLIPGHLWPVNPWSVTHVPSLFAINERIAILMKTQWGPLAVVMVGATNVGQMSLAFDSQIVTNQGGGARPMQTVDYHPGLPVRAGDELGVFNMGSTVVMLVPSSLSVKKLQLGPVKMGVSLLD